MKRQLLTHENAKPCKTQHKSPCSDCPFARKSLAGWLGGINAHEWMRIVRGEAIVQCHTKIGPQCAGAAIFRANIFKAPRDPKILQLEKDRTSVFSTVGEFLNHHLKTDRFDLWGREKGAVSIPTKRE